MQYKVYLSGEIHSNWRSDIVEACVVKKLPVEFITPVTDHDASDEVGAKILGNEMQNFWKDHKAAKINTIRIQNGIAKIRSGGNYVW
jgi:YtoQ family protein